MANTMPMNANLFIEQQLHRQAKDLERMLNSDLLTLVGEIEGNVDDIVRDMVEIKHRQPPARDKLTMFVTTTGGYIDIVKRIVETLRHFYRLVDFVIPNYAFSAGTVLVMSGDVIYMDYYSRLGPIDPQVQNSSGRMVPALGYLKQYERLVEKANNGSITIPEIQLMINGFDQAELYQYDQARQLSISLLEEWLVKYKFKNWATTRTRNLTVTPEMKKGRAIEVATRLNDTDRWHTHGYGISMEVLSKDLNLIINDFGQNIKLSNKIKEYSRLLEDYMQKVGHGGIIHIAGEYSSY
jgi:membrane-bound ClpP family serine protease